MNLFIRKCKYKSIKWILIKLKLKMSKIKMNVKCCLDKWTNYKNRKRISFLKVKRNQKLMSNRLIKLRNRLHIKKINKYLMFHKGFKISIMVGILHKITDNRQTSDRSICTCTLFFKEFLVICFKFKRLYFKKPLKKSCSFHFHVYVTLNVFFIIYWRV